MKHSSGLLAVALVVAASCGDSKDEPAAPVAAATPPAPPLIERAFTDADPAAVDRAAAERLPGDTAAAITIADLPKLIARIGLGDDADSILRALRDELTAWLGFDLLDADAAADAGVDASQPVTLAWLDPAGETIALVIAVADRDKLERALGDRPAIVSGDRAVIPLGDDADATRDQLTQVEPASSLAVALDAAGSAGFGTDGAVYVNGGELGLGARSLAIGFTVRPDSIHARALARFTGPPPGVVSWGHRIASRTDVIDRYDEVPYAHQLVREIERGTDDPRVVFPVAPLIGQIAPDFYGVIGDRLGFAVFAGAERQDDLVYYGGVAFNGALAGELVALAARTGTSTLARGRALARARDTGILARIDSSQYATITGTADFGSGLDDVDVYGGLSGNQIGSMTGGFGSIDTSGGGGTGWGTIGGGTLDSGGGGLGVGGGRLGKARGPQARAGNAKVTGSLDKSIIRRYIRRHLPRFKYCYEKELASEPDLEGKVTASFVIGANGKVTSASADGMHAGVSSCVARVLRAMEFPRPKGGGVVSVTYPFTFKNP